jgi:predicted NAD/FAD-binding protein
MSLDDYVRRGRYGRDFFELYLIPMSSAVWSTPPDKMRQFPAATLLRFFHNHGFLGLHTQHPWWTVGGGAQSYVQKLIVPFQDRIHLRTPVRAVRRIPTGGVEVSTATAATRFDKVIFACHPPAVLEILGNDATSDERRLLGAFQYQPNTVTLHTDESVLPRARLARAAWNYRIDSADDGSGVSTHYWMNRLQGVSDRKNYFVSVEGTHLLNPNQTLHTFAEEHPLFDLGAAQAQTQIAGLNAAARGNTETYVAGAWQRYGFHEDGLLSAVNLATLLLGHDAWSKTPAPKEQP